MPQISYVRWPLLLVAALFLVMLGWVRFSLGASCYKVRAKGYRIGYS